MDQETKKLTAHSVLGYLREAGEAGATTTEIALAHDYPAPYQQRSNRVSQVLKILAAEGSARFLGTERSPLYRRGPVRRWQVTPAGIARHEHGSATEQRIAASQDREEQLSTELAAAARRRMQALDRVRREIENRVLNGGLGAVTAPWRELKIIELRAVPCSLAEIAQLFGLSRERVRQIELNIRDRAGTARGPG